MSSEKEYIVGVISDTHGGLPYSLQSVFKDVDLIIHAGDINDQITLIEPKEIAPVHAIRGNMDRDSFGSQLSEYEIVNVGDVLICVIHDLMDLDIDPAAMGVSIVISGHTHRPALRQQDGIMYLNPGSAREPRGSFLPSVALLTIRGEEANAVFVEF